MANWIITDTVNLRHPTVNMQGTAAEVLMLPLDNKAHTWQVVVRDGYVDADLSGKSCYAYFARKDNTKVLVNGTITGNICSVTLDSTCYALPGFLRAVMIMSATDQTVAICEKTFRVNPALPGQTVDPGEVLPSIDDLLAEIGAMRLATADANAATNAAQTATTAANTAAQTANTNASAAQTAANNANQATTAANQATTNANTAAQNANTKANAAQAAANNAYQAATSATEATNAAQTATDDANEAAQNANEAASTITTQIDRLDRTDGNQNARLTNIESVTEGFLYNVVEDSETAYSKTVPDKTLPYANLDMVGGKTLVWNQLASPNVSRTVGGVNIVCENDGKVTLNGTSSISGGRANYIQIGVSITNGHRYAFFHPFTASLFFTEISGDTFLAGRNNTVAVATKTAIYGIGFNLSPGTEYNESGYIRVHDLTAMFGAGNEPTVEEFKAMFPAEYYPYSEPTLMNFSADNVVSKGRNLLDLKKWYDGTETQHVTNGLSITYSETEKCLVINGTTVTSPAASVMRFTLDKPLPYRDGMVSGVKYLGGTMTKNGQPYSLFFIGGSLTQSGSSNWFTVEMSESDSSVQPPHTEPFAFNYVTEIWFYISDGVTYNNYKVRPIIAYSNTFEPYFESANDLSTLVSKYFPDAMKSAGTVHDEIDLERGVAVKRVGSVDLGTLEWTYLESRNWFVSNGVIDMIKKDVAGSINVMSCAKYMPSTDVWINNDIEGCVANFATISIRDNNAQGDVATFVQRLQGVLLHYELAQPIETPIDPADLADLAVLNIEPGGTLTFANDKGDDYRVPLPNAETWKFNIEDDVVRYDTEQSLTTAQKTTARNNIGAAGEDEVIDLQTRVATIENMDGLHRYGVTGIGLADTQLTRLYDAVGMTAQVGTDGDNSNIINNFDDVAPFNRRKCVGEWSLYEGKPVFHVNAYYGDPDYNENGSMGDYVAVDCTPAYYMYDKENGTLVISAHHYEGYRPFDCLMDRSTNECRPHTYLPCYALAVKNGHAVSLPGLRNEQGDYKKLFDTCKTAANNAASQAILMPIAVNFYEWAMFTVEFATTNCQSVMQGCANLRHSNDDLIVMSSETEGIVQNHQAARVAGEYVSIQPSNVDINTYTWLASHRIVSVERCDQDGTLNASGTYDHVTFEVLDNTRTIEAGTTYRFAARPYNTGACNTVSTPSGSPVNNQNGYYPMKYRWRENVYGNQFQTVADLMNFAVVEEGFTDVNANYAAHLEWYYRRDTETLTPANYANSTAGRDAMIAAGWELLDVSTPAENYINGYVKSRDYSHKYPDVWKPGLTVGASASTYYADYAYLVTPHLLRAVRLGGNWSSGSSDGFSSANANNAPSAGSAHFGGSLYYPQ